MCCVVAVCCLQVQECCGFFGLKKTTFRQWLESWDRTETVHSQFALKSTGQADSTQSYFCDSPTRWDQRQEYWIQLSNDATGELNCYSGDKRGWTLLGEQETHLQNIARRPKLGHNSPRTTCKALILPPFREIFLPAAISLSHKCTSRRRAS